MPNNSAPATEPGRSESVQLNVQNEKKRYLFKPLAIYLNYRNWPTESVYALVGLAVAIALVPWNSLFWAAVVTIGFALVLSVLPFTSSDVENQESNNDGNSQLTSNNLVSSSHTPSWKLRLITFISAALVLAFLWLPHILWGYWQAFGSWWMLLPICISLFLAASIYWDNNPYTMGRMLGGITVGSILVTALLLRIWLDVNLWSAVQEEGDTIVTHDNFDVAFPKRFAVGSNSQSVRITKRLWAEITPTAYYAVVKLPNNLASISSTLPISISAIITPYISGEFSSEPTTMLIGDIHTSVFSETANISVTSQVPVTVSLAVSPSSAIIFLPKELSLELHSNATSSAEYSATVEHNMSYFDCENASNFVQQFALWVEVVLGSRCHWAEGSIVATFGMPTSYGTQISMVEQQLQIETVHRGRFRQFVTSTAAAQSPLLFFLPSLLAIAAYVFNQSYVREKQVAENEFSERKKSAAELRAQLRAGNYTEAFQYMRTLDTHVVANEFSPEECQLMEFWNAVATSTECPQYDPTTFSKILTADSNITCGVLEMRYDSMPLSLDWYAMTAHVLSSQTISGSTCSSSLEDKFNKAKLAKEQIKSNFHEYPLEQPQMEQLYARDVVDPGSRHIFFEKLPNHDPFKYPCAEQEEVALSIGGMYWAEHPVTVRMLDIPNTVICGPAGSGKTALSIYLSTRLVEGESNKSEQFSIWLNEPFDIHRYTWCIAQKICRLAVNNLQSLSDNEQQKAVLVSFLADILGVERIVSELEQAKARQSGSKSISETDQRAQWMQSFYSEFSRRVLAAADSRQRTTAKAWLLQLYDISRALGFQGCQLVIDDMTETVLKSRKKLFRELNDRSINLVLVTENPLVADSLSTSGFREAELLWTPEQLAEMTCHRLNQLSRKLSSLDIPANPDDLTVQILTRDMFESQAWEQLCQDAPVPRDLLKVLSRLISTPGLTPPLERESLKKLLTESGK